MMDIYPYKYNLMLKWVVIPTKFLNAKEKFTVHNSLKL